MAVEAPGLIKDFNPAWPQDGDDCVEGDNHIRLVKGNLLAQFPNLEAAVTPTAVELNHTAGATSNLQAQIDAINATIADLQLVPTGMIAPYGAVVPPTGWVLADGSLYDGTNPVYTPLWNVYGTTFGGTGQSSFAVPDIRGRTPIGTGTGVGLSTRALNDQVGAESVLLTNSELPSAIGNPDVATVNTGFAADVLATGTGAGSLQNTAGGTPHENMQPSLGLPFIIKL